jgi:tetratricopeptide (TPR) repeat protein
MEASVREQVDAMRRGVTSLPAPGEASGAAAAAFGHCGQVYLAYDLVAPAEACFVNAAALDPLEPRWHYYLGLIRAARGEQETAAAALREALRLRPAEPAALLRLGDLELQVGRPAAARELYQRAAAADPRARPAALHGLARVALQEGDPRAAVAPLEEALTQQPAAGVLHYLLGTTLRRLGDSAAARQHLARATTDAVAYPDPWGEQLVALDRGARGAFRRGTELLTAGHTSEAAAELRRATDLAPGDAQAWLNLGVAQERLGDLAGAAASYRRAAEQAPLNSRARYNLGSLLLRQGNEEGIDWLEEAVRLDPESENGRFNLALALLASGRAGPALAHLDWLRQRRPDDLEVRYQRALALLELGRPEDALSEIGPVAAAAPAAPPVRLAEARALLATGRERDARDRLEEAASRLPGDEALALLRVGVLAGAAAADVRDGAAAWELASRLLAAGWTPARGGASALALAELGRFDEAVTAQGRVVEALPPGSGDRAEAEARLARYRAGAPVREPWRPLQ